MGNKCTKKVNSNVIATTLFMHYNNVVAMVEKANLVNMPTSINKCKACGHICKYDHIHAMAIIISKKYGSKYIKTLIPRIFNEDPGINRMDLVVVAHILYIITYTNQASCKYIKRINAIMSSEIYNKLTGYIKIYPIPTAPPYDEV